MVIFSQPEEDPQLQAAIDEVYREMSGVESDSPEYREMVDRLVKLYTLRPARIRVNPDTLVNVAAHLTGILLILQNERLHIVTSKALSFIPRLK